MSHTIVYPTYKEESLSKEDWVAHWIGPHGDLGKQIPGLLSYQILVVDEAIDAEEPQPDGFVIQTFESRESAEAALASEEMAATVADAEGKFRHFDTFHVDTYWMVGGPNEEAGR
jgi:uncharacterized protein (TIGR02118 family)